METNAAKTGGHDRLNWGAVGRLSVGLGSTVAVLGLVYLLARPLALLVLAITLAQALSPLADWLQRFMPRPLGVSLVYVLLAGAVALLGWLVVPPLAAETAAFAQQLPDLLDDARQWMGELGQGADLGRGVASAVSGSLQSVLAVPLRGISLAFDLLVVVFLSLYFLIAGPGYQRFVVALFPNRHRRRAARLLHRVGNAMGGYVRGVVLDSLLVAGLTWVGLKLVGIEYALALSALMFVGELIPYLGPILAGIPAVLVGLVTSPGKALAVGLLYLAIVQIEGHIIAPNIMRTQTNVSPALVILALACGIAAGGLIGGLVAIPLFAAAQVLLLSLVAPVLRRRGRAGGAK